MAKQSTAEQEGGFAGEPSAPVDQATAKNARGAAAISTQPPKLFGQTVKETTARLTLLITYLGALGALVIGFNKFSGEIGLESRILLVGGAVLPLLIVFATHTLPIWLRSKRERRLVEEGISGTLTHPSYFQLTPYEER